MNWDEGLGPEQTVAAGAPRGHAVLLAGPGTGKTFVLIRRVQFLVEEHGVDPTHITALTFSRAAAAEMRERLTATLGSTGRKVRVSTLHSYALQQLLAHGARQLPSPLRIADDWEEKNIVVVELARLLGRKVRDISNGRDGALDRLGGIGILSMQTGAGGRLDILMDRSSQLGDNIARCTDTHSGQSLSISC